MPSAPVRRFPDLTPYRSIPTPELNRALDEVERGAQLTAEAPLLVASVPSGFHLLLDRSREPFWAEITSGTNPYAWKEKDATASGTWADTPRGRTGTTTFRPAYERNDNAGAAAGTVVRLYPTFANTTGTAEQEYAFTAPAAAALTVRNDVSPTVSVPSVTTLNLGNTGRGGFVLSTPGAGIATYTPPQQWCGANYSMFAGGQTVATGALTAVNWNFRQAAGTTTAFEAVPTTTLTTSRPNGWGTASNLLTLVNAQVVFEANGAGVRYAEITAGGVCAGAVTQPACAGVETVLNLSCVGAFAWGTTVFGVNVWQNSGGNLVIGRYDGSVNFDPANSTFIDTRISIAPFQYVSSS